MDMSSRQVSYLQPTPSSQQITWLKFTPTPSTESNCIDDNLNWLKWQTERTRRTMTTSTLKSILHLSISQTANCRCKMSSVQAWIWMATPLIGKTHSKSKELSSQPVDVTRVKSHLALASVLKEHIFTSTCTHASRKASQRITLYYRRNEYERKDSCTNNPFNSESSVSIVYWLSLPRGWWSNS